MLLTRPARMPFYNALNPVFLALGPLELRYYGLAYVIGFGLGYLFLLYLARQRRFPLKRAVAADFVLWSVVGLMLGARLGYVLFYNLPYYLANPLEIVAVWRGGMSFHGGLIGILVAGLIFCARRKLSWQGLADMVVIPASLAMALVRLTNFINGELYGRLTTLPWAVKFAGVPGLRHPSQLYEAGYDIALFAILWTLKDRKAREGSLFWTFIALYGLFRFLTEFVRAPDPQLGFVLGPFTMGQLLTLPMALAGFVVLGLRWLRSRLSQVSKLL